MSDAAPLIHPTAVIDPSAVLGAGVQVGAYAVIGAEVVIGDNTRIGPHCVLEGPTTIGRDNVFHGQAAIGGAPQDKKYRGERVELVIGDGNVVREFVTLNRGTGDGGGITRVGDRNWILAYTHIAHDCIIGSDCVFSNNATLAGHVSVGDFVIISGFRDFEYAQAALKLGVADYILKPIDEKELNATLAEVKARQENAADGRPAAAAAARQDFVQVLRGQCPAAGTEEVNRKYGFHFAGQGDFLVLWLALCGAADEQFIRVGLAAPGLGHPGDAGFCFRLDHALYRAVSGLGSDCRANYWLCTCHQRSLRHTVSRRPSPPE